MLNIKDALNENLDMDTEKANRAVARAITKLAAGMA